MYYTHKCIAYILSVYVYIYMCTHTYLLWNIPVCSFQYVKNDKEKNTYENWPELISIEGCLSPTTVWHLRTVSGLLHETKSSHQKWQNSKREPFKINAECSNYPSPPYLTIIPKRSRSFFFLPSFCAFFSQCLPDGFKNWQQLCLKLLQLKICIWLRKTDKIVPLRKVCLFLHSLKLKNNLDLPLLTELWAGSKSSYISLKNNDGTAYVTLLHKLRKRRKKYESR